MKICLLEQLPQTPKFKKGEHYAEQKKTDYYAPRGDREGEKLIEEKMKR